MSLFKLTYLLQSTHRHRVLFLSSFSFVLICLKETITLAALNISKEYKIRAVKIYATPKSRSFAIFTYKAEGKHGNSDMLEVTYTLGRDYYIQLNISSYKRKILTVPRKMYNGEEHTKNPLPLFACL